MERNTLQIIPMSQEYACRIAEWNYEGIYSFYNHHSSNIEEFMDGTHFAGVDETGGLIGYFCFGSDARIPTLEEQVYQDGFLDIGMGLRPDLCGKGLGLPFMEAGLAYAGGRYRTASFRLSVAAFNERAVKVYRRAGFVTECEVTNAYFGNLFYIMTKQG